jgi:hypothetical protein
MTPEIATERIKVLRQRGVPEAEAIRQVMGVQMPPRPTTPPVKMLPPVQTPPVSMAPAHPLSMEQRLLQRHLGPHPPAIQAQGPPTSIR